MKLNEPTNQNAIIVHKIKTTNKMRWEKTLGAIVMPNVSLHHNTREHYSPNNNKVRTWCPNEPFPRDFSYHPWFLSCKHIPARCSASCQNHLLNYQYSLKTCGKGNKQSNHYTKLTGCLAVYIMSKDLANHWTDMILFYSLCRFLSVHGRFLTFWEKERESMGERVLKKPTTPTH